MAKHRVSSIEKSQKKKFKMGKKTKIFVIVFAILFVIAGLVYAASKITITGGHLRVSSLQKGIVGHWILDAESYNSNTARVTDKTPYENHGTNYGATFTTDQMGQSDRAMSFDGVDDYVDVSGGHVVNNNAGTITMWIKPTYGDDTRIDNEYLFSNGRPVGAPNSIGLIARACCGYPYDKIIYICNSTCSSYTCCVGTEWDNNVWVGGNWYFVNAVWDFNTSSGSSYISLYNNGVRVTHITKAYPYSGMDLPDIFYIGTYSATNSFDGSISDVRIYNHALSAEEIDTLYHSYRPKLSAGSLLKGLILDMPLKFKYTKDETPGSEILTDRTPYSNDGQNYGANVGTDYTTFDGVDNYVEALPVPSDIGAFSVVLWINTTRQNDFVYYIHRGVSASIGGSIFCLGEYANYLMWAVNGRYEAGKSSTLIPESEFICLIGTYDGDKARLFLNGDLIHTDTFGAITSEPSGNKMGIGGTAHPYANRFTDGSISDVRIYNRVLSPSEIKLSYDKGR
ncbi:hypothetical protein ES703_23790 [subsurface metagenome]